MATTAANGAGNCGHGPKLEEKVVVCFSRCRCSARREEVVGSSRCCRRCRHCCCRWQLLPRRQPPTPAAPAYRAFCCAHGEGRREEERWRGEEEADMWDPRGSHAESAAKSDKTGVKTVKGPSLHWFFEAQLIRSISVSDTLAPIRGARAPGHTRFASGGVALEMRVAHALCAGAGTTKFLSDAARRRRRCGSGWTGRGRGGGEAVRTRPRARSTPRALSSEDGGAPDAVLPPLSSRMLNCAAGGGSRCSSRRRCRGYRCNVICFRSKEKRSFERSPRDRSSSEPDRFEIKIMTRGGRGDREGEDVDSWVKKESEWEEAGDGEEDDYSDETEYDDDEESSDEDDDYFSMENRDVRFALEEKWESQIMEQMKFFVSTADPFGIMTIWKGSLHVDGPCQSLDPNLLSMNNFMPQLPLRRKKKNNEEPCRRAIQVFGLTVSSPDNAIQEIYGMFAFRDIRNSQERNFIFEYPRDRPFTLKPGSDKVQPLIQPPRGIYAIGPVVMEYHLMIKGQEEQEDRVLVDGYSIYCPSFYKERSRFHWHIDTGHCGAIDLKMAAVPNAVLATVEIEVIRLGGTHYDSLAIVVALSIIKGMYLVFDGKVSVGKLLPFTVCINREMHLKLFVYGYSSSQIGHGDCSPDGVVSDYDNDGFFSASEDVYYDVLNFIPQFGTYKKMSHNLEDMDVSVTPRLQRHEGMAAYLCL
uniref:DUF6598 domain-containing protein n=1 Tax=Oryza rufipogon TaxID=4529 RepID=A0A1V1FFT3_ORYRU|nr:hypothetical protein [Oryza rufipogon]